MVCDRGHVRRFINWFLLIRPVFLLGGFLLYGLGIVMAVAGGAAFNLSRYLLGQLIVTIAQLATQLSNEVYDMEADRLNDRRTWFTGGSGILQTGVISSRLILHISRALYALALALIVLAAVQVPTAGLVAAFAWLGAWAYSAPPLSLVASGFGEIDASVIVAWLASLTGFALLTGNLAGWAVMACLPLVLIHMAMLIVFSLPDIASDRIAGKRTLAVRLGAARAVRLANTLILAAYLAYFVYGFAFPQQSSVVAHLWWTAPLALSQVLMDTLYARGRWQNDSLLTLGAIALFAFNSLLLGIGFFLLALN